LFLVSNRKLRHGNPHRRAVRKSTAPRARAGPLVPDRQRGHRRRRRPGSAARCAQLPDLLEGLREGRLVFALGADTACVPRALGAAWQPPTRAGKPGQKLPLNLAKRGLLLGMGGVKQPQTQPRHTGLHGQAIISNK
jgi:hypothetical protein